MSACIAAPEHPRIPVITTLDGSYNDAFYGFSLQYPETWTARKGGIGGAELTLFNTNRSCNIQVFVDALDDPATPKQYSASALSDLEAKLSYFQILKEGAIQLHDHIGYEYTFEGIESGNYMKANLVCLTEQERAFVILAAAYADIYDLIETQIESTIYSFELGEPFSMASISRDEALILPGVPPITLDPALILDSDSVIYIQEIFSGLVTLTPQMEIVPDIAQRWNINDDGTVYTFHLRTNAKFHNGNPVTAQDFKYSLERACDPKTGSQIAGTYLNDIVGAEEKLVGISDQIGGIEVIDEHTLQITIKAPSAYFLSKLTYPTAFVLDQENVETDGQWWLKPNGTGPFQIDMWEKDQLLILRKYEDYYREPANIDYVIFRMWSGRSMAMYEQGEIDITEVPGTSIERVLDPASRLNSELVSIPELSVNYVGFNVSEPPFDDVKVRQAFCHAIDKEKLLEALFIDTVEKASGILPPALPGYNENIQGLEFDPEKARELIAQSSYGSVSALPRLTYTASGRGFVSPLTEALIDMWRTNLGVEVSIRQIDPESYPYTIKEEKDQLFDIGWLADYPDPHSFLDTLFHSQSGDNIGEYGNSEIDMLLETARRELNPDLRFEIYQEVEQMLVDSAACLPLYFGRQYILVKPYVHGFEGNPLPMPWLKYVTLEPH